MLVLVPEGDGELTAQVIEHPLLVVFPGVRNQLGIAVGPELMAATFQPGLGFGVVEELAVEDDVNAAVLVADGLPAVAEANDAEPARGQPQPGTLQVAVLVRPSVDQTVGHGAQTTRGQGDPVHQVNHAGDSTHPRVLSGARRTDRKSVL